jgi:hypothetical protein
LGDDPLGFFDTLIPGSIAVASCAVLIILGSVGKDYYDDHIASTKEALAKKQSLMMNPNFQTQKWQKILTKEIAELKKKQQEEEEKAKKKEVENQKTLSKLSQTLDVRPERKNLAEELKSQSNKQNEQAGSHGFFRESEQRSTLVESIQPNRNYNVNQLNVLPFMMNPIHNIRAFLQSYYRNVPKNNVQEKEPVSMNVWE